METNAVKTFKKSVAELQVSYNKKNQVKSIKVTNSKSAADFIRNVYPIDLETREAFMCLYLNRANNVQSFSVISIGGIAGTVADVRVIYQHALLCNASSLILIHNHPSGNTKPSQPDLQLTKKIKQAGEIMDMQVLDHIILTAESYFSFADEGLL